MDFFRILSVAGCIFVLKAQPLDVQVISVATLSEKNQEIMKSPQQTLRNSEVKWPTRIGPRYELTSALAKKIEQFQSDCSVPGTFYNLNHAGFGSDLHVFSQVLALGMTSGKRLFTENNKYPQWTWRWLSLGDCEPEQGLSCYFQIKTCDKEDDQTEEDKTFPLTYFGIGYHEFRLNSCEDWLKRKASPNFEYELERILSNDDLIGFLACENNGDTSRLRYRAAFSEYLFSTGLTNPVKNEVIRQMNQVFGTQTVPQNLVTIHLRWGNKDAEAPRIDIEEYRKAVEKMVNEKSLQTNGERINIYLATEDPRGPPALKAELEKAASEDTDSIWFTNGFEIYVDATVEINLENGLRPVIEGVIDTVLDQRIASASKGKYGLQVLASLLIAMEADGFVLTTSSNFSRLINEIRTNVVDVQCGGCTEMVDLQVGGW